MSGGDGSVKGFGLNETKIVGGERRKKRLSDSLKKSHLIYKTGVQETPPHHFLCLSLLAGICIWAWSGSKALFQYFIFVLFVTSLGRQKTSDMKPGNTVL